MSLTIGELSLGSGVPIATLRDWDRRHGLSPSQRTIGGHRRYTELDAALVVRVRELVADGLRLRAAIPQARLEQQAEAAAAGNLASQVLDQHLRVREAVAATREATLARREQLVAERLALVARREAMVRNRHRPMVLPDQPVVTT
jgi:DNA-binding transcriptional MerR regulator